MKNGCLMIIAILGVLWIIGFIVGGDNNDPTENGKVSYTCVWCKKIFVGNDGDLSCYYYDEVQRGCGYHTVTQNTLTGFCTIEHCELYREANNAVDNSIPISKGETSRSNELNKMFKKDGSDIESCPSKSMHYQIQNPYKCPSCSYVGK